MVINIRAVIVMESLMERADMIGRMAVIMRVILWTV